MFTLSMSTLIVFMSAMFMNLNHPMLMVTSIIFQTILLCIMLWKLNGVSWFSYILFLVMLGALMILFIYICSLASNEKMNFKLDYKIMMGLTISLVFMINSKLNTQQMLYTMILSKMIVSPMMLMAIMCMFFLLITLIIVVKIVKYKFSPLRSKKS